MANKINIIITAEEKARGPIRSVGNELDSASSKASKFDGALASLGGTVKHTSLALGAAGVAAAGAGVAIGFDFNSQVEQSRTKLMAFMKDGERVARTLDWVKQEAAATQFSFTDMADAAANLTPVAKSSGVALEDLIRQAEILAAINPTEGLTGATFSLREALSGDWVSIIDRFNLPRKRINELKEEGVPAMQIISRTLGEMGIEYGLVADQGKTVAARWDQINDKLKMMAGTATKPIFDRVSAQLDVLGAYDYEALGTNIASAIEFVFELPDKVSSFFSFLGEKVDWLRSVGEGTLSWVAGAGRDALAWLEDRANDASKAWESFMGWVEKNEGAIKGVAITLGVIFGPALLKAAAQATIAGVQIAASGASAGAGWVAGAVASGVAWTVNSLKMIALSAGIYTLMAIAATKAGWAWTVASIKSLAAWTANMAKLAVVSSLTAVKVAVSAADAGWAWIINAGRASFVWVVTELPKIVAAAAVTAVQSTLHAGAASAAWIAGASRAAFAWVVTELPRIVIGFLTASGSATVHAGITAGAWIASASQSAIAWAVTQLPRIIAAFAAASAAAVVHAAVAAGAWIGSAVSSSAAVGALRLLVATPMVMPAIAVAAALAAIGLVIVKTHELIGLLRSVGDQVQKNMDSSRNTDAAMKRMFDEGKISLDKYNQYLRNTENNANQTKNNMYSGFFGPLNRSFDDLFSRIAGTKDKFQGSGFGGHALGTNASPGGWRVVGEHGPEPMYVPQGAQVIPHYRAQGAAPSNGGPVLNMKVDVHNNTDYNKMLSDIGFALRLAS